MNGKGWARIHGQWCSAPGKIAIPEILNSSIFLFFIEPYVVDQLDALVGIDA